MAVKRPALRRAANLCDGWIGNAYPIEECERYVAELRGMLEKAGRDPVGYEIILGVHALPTPDVCERMSAAGVTGMMCVPWMQGRSGHGVEVSESQRGTELEQKIEATFAFAESVIEPAADI